MQKTHTWVVLLAAGEGKRIGVAKQFFPYQGVPLWWHSVRTFARSPHIQGVVVIFPKTTFDEADQSLQELVHKNPLGIPILAVPGGALRQDSVLSGLRAIPDTCSHVLIHDSARPFFTPSLISSLMQAFLENPLLTTSPLKDAIAGTIPALPVTDTIKRVEHSGSMHEKVIDTLDRDSLRAVQTPQAFIYRLLKDAHENKENIEYSDDAVLMESFGHTIFAVPGEPENIKITHTKDLTLLIDTPVYEPCTGFGYDVHKYGGDRPLLLGTVHIPCDIKVSAHSDGDVLLHALMDALLSCMGKGDIGKLFPNTDAQFDNISSALLLDRVMELWYESALKLCHVDITLVCQKPHIAPYTRQIEDSLSQHLNLNTPRINVKATTEEGLGFTGQKLGIKAYAVVSALRSSIIRAV